MEDQLYKNAGRALIIGSVLMVLTMILHPVGGDIHHLIRISQVIIISHSLAIASIPINFYGFWGLTTKLGKTDIFSLLAFIIMGMSLLGAMLAASINGLALPFFVDHYGEANADTINAIHPVLEYSFALNKAMTIIYIVGSCLSVSLWSMAIIKQKSLPVWIGYLGLSLGVIAVILLLSGFVFNDLHGLRIFVVGNVVWTILTAYSLIKAPN
ncbi:MAG: hypothetical protein AAFN93_02095 [Bacteroidota bacterium]